MYKFFVLLNVSLFVFILSATGCSSQKTFGDKVKALGEQWNEGDSMITEGEAMVQKGTEMIRQGNLMIKQGHQLKADSERSIQKNPME
jgi:hypothetical protein